MIALSEKPGPGMDFFWLLRQIQARFKDRPKIGSSLRPDQDLVRLQHPPDLEFPPSSIVCWTESPVGRAPRLDISFLGLFGPNGALPLHLTEYAKDRVREGDHTLTSFVNLFQHRLLSLFFKAWAVHQKTVDMDRGESEAFSKYFGSFIGIGMPSLRNRDEIHDNAKYYFSGRLATHSRNAEGLGAILSEYFSVLVRIEDFSGRWLRMPVEDRCRLGETKATGILGQTVVLGERIWECQTKFRIRMGPMALEDFKRLLPTGDSFKRLKVWVLNYVGLELEWDVQLVLQAAEVPQTCLGSGGYLGWTTWLRSVPFLRDAEDVIFNPNCN
ncbi:MAG: type VI secretion system baseplate subunit TssG [Verrucomicrobiota bacterium]